MGEIPEKFEVVIKPAQDESGNLISGICVICGDKSRNEKSYVCKDDFVICLERAISKGYIVPKKESG